MKKWFTFLLGFSVVLVIVACEKTAVSALDEELKDAMSKTVSSGDIRDYLLPDGSDYSKIPNQDAKNPINSFKVALGKMLFYETGIGLVGHDGALKQTYSCSSCHIPSMGFTPGRFQGIADGAVGFGDHGEGRHKSELYLGEEVDAQGARPLTMHNLAYVTNTLWSGTFGSFGTNVGTEHAWSGEDTLVQINFLGLEGLEANNFRALQVHRQLVNRQITDSLGYTALFDAAFPDIPHSERYSLKTTAFAIAAYFRTILTNKAPFQEWIKGDASAMTEQQKRGAIVFFTKGHCTNCHQGPALNAMRYEAVGVNDLYESGHEVFRTGPNDKRNLGRGGFTKDPRDYYKFKVPQLYNLKHTQFYFHGSSKTSLEEVVDYFDAAVPENPRVPVEQLSPVFRPLYLSAQEKTDLVEFLRNGLYDPFIERYVPSSVMSGNCFPNNDHDSKRDLGCN